MHNQIRMTMTVFWIAAFCFSNAATIQSAEPYYARFDVPSLAGSYGISSADFDEDGNMDIVTCCEFFNSYYLCLYFGDGTGMFPSRIDRYHNGLRPNAVQTADFNMDQHADIVVTNTLDHTIGVYLGDGTGSFGSYFTTGDFEYPTSLAVDHLDGDQYEDVVAVSWVYGKAGVFLGQGDGFFQNGDVYDVGGGTTMVVTADFFEDGSRDLAISNMAFNDVVVLFGYGDGTFYGMKSLDVGYDAFALAAPDLDNDSHDDIVVVTKHAMVTFLGDGSGSFVQDTSFITYQSPGARDIEVLDADEDGNVDIVCSFYGNDRVRVYRGDGLGGFPTHRLIKNVVAPLGLCTGDFNTDGHTDIAVSSADDDVLSIFLSQWEVVKLDLTPPFDPDVQPGATLVFDVSATNTQDSTVAMDIWLSAARGNGGEFRIPSSIIEGPENPLPLVLDPGENREFHYEVEIPLAITPGYYKLLARSGNFSGDTMDEVSFDGQIIEN